MDEQEFKNARGPGVGRPLPAAFGGWRSDYDFEADFNGGALVIEFEDAAGEVRGESQCAGKPDLGFGADEEFQAGLGRGRRARSCAADSGRRWSSWWRGGGAATGRRSDSVEVAGVYISYPFCAQKCTYCNFASGVFPGGTGGALPGRFAGGAGSTRSGRGRRETVYLGGGTPSQMAAGGAGVDSGGDSRAAMARGDHGSCAGGNDGRKRSRRGAMRGSIG